MIRHWLENNHWDGILLGNLDLLGVDLLHWLLGHKLPVLHHVGFVHSPYAIEQQPNVDNYHLLAASHAVKSRLIEEGIHATTHQSFIQVHGLTCLARKLSVGSYQNLHAE